MRSWAAWLIVALGAWIVFALFATVLLGRMFAALRRGESADDVPATPATPSRAVSLATTATGDRRRILVVDDDPALRLLLKTTFATDEFDVEEAASADEAIAVARFWRPDVVVLDVQLPGPSGLEIARELKRPRYGSPLAVLLTGADTTPAEARAATADALLRKPFSPLELLRVIDEAAGGLEEPRTADVADSEQLLIYARDMNRLLNTERHHRRLLQHAYRQTATALADALEARDPRTGHHALRVQQYALELADAVDASLLEDASLEYGFLLHDIGKIAIPDGVLNKPGPLTESERALVRQHPTIGVAILSDVQLLDGAGIGVVRSHHERWDGTGYPDRLAATEIPLAARVFALADALDAITSDRPYRAAAPWSHAVDEILANTGRQFDPKVVAAFARREQRLRRIHDDLMPTAA